MSRHVGSTTREAAARSPVPHRAVGPLRSLRPGRQPSPPPHPALRCCGWEARPAATRCGIWRTVVRLPSAWLLAWAMLSAITVARAEGIAMSAERRPPSTLFPTDLPGPEWQQFRSAGFTKPACGVIYRLRDRVTNGVALGGVDTGCIDLETSGLLGYCTIFNTHVPRRGPLNLPILGLSVGGQTWVLCDPQVKQGEGGAQTPIEPGVSGLSLDGVATADEIHYWGHYPVADLEFVTSAPVSVGLRAWSPFLPGDVASSMMPAIVIEAHLRNVNS
jgi:hypothetical protein